MTETQLVQQEIERFLTSPEPEVICITGRWGVGKTYNWQKHLDRLRNARRVGLSRYSYISLFGINSLEGLKQSIFENMEFLTPEGRTTFERMGGIANKGFQQAKKLTGALSTIPMVGDALARVTQPFLFSSIRNQIVCIDDLERRGANLSVKDVLGLVSFLREQRGCKVALLLNEDRLTTDASASKEFKEYFEKVIDAKLVFAPSATEAAEIAFPGKDSVSQLLAEYSIRLAVRNIRVMKKVERLVGIALPAIGESNEEITRQVVHSLVIFGWSQFDAGDDPPTLEYLRDGSLLRHFSRKHGEEPTAQEKRWDTITESYAYTSSDDLDLTLMHFVESGVLDSNALQQVAKRQEEAIRRRNQAGSFEKSFNPLHDSFADNENEVVNAAIAGIKNNLDVVSLSNVNEVTELLERLQNPALSEDLIDFVAKNGPEHLWTQDSAFFRSVRDARLQKIAAERQQMAKPPFEFEKDLIDAAKSLNHEKLEQLAARPVPEFVELFDRRTGGDLRLIIDSALDYRRIGNSSEPMKEIVRKAEAALRIIGNRSPLNAFRIERYGVNLTNVKDEQQV